MLQPLEILRALRATGGKLVNMNFIPRKAF